MRIDDYEILSELGRGGMGLVHKARAVDGTLVALKVLKPHASESGKRRFEREVQSLLRLRHPHVVRLLDAGLHGGAPWFAMELVEGQSLAARLRSGGALPLDQVVSLGRQLGEALQAAHAIQIAHRDVKPDNVLFARDGRVVLADFGLTKDFEVAESLRLSRTGAIAGTPAYWSPEQAGGEPAGLPSDVYSLGATLYAALTGDAPFIETSSFLALVIATRERQPDRPSQRGVEAPRWLEALLFQMLAKQPEARPSIDQVLAVLERQPVLRRGSTRLGLVLAVLSLFLIAGLAWRSAASQEPRPAPPSRTPGAGDPPDLAVPKATPTVSLLTPTYTQAFELQMGGGEVRGAWRSPTRVVVVSARGRLREWRLDLAGPRRIRERRFRAVPLAAPALSTWRALHVVEPVEDGVWVAGPAAGLIFLPDAPKEPAITPIPGLSPTLACLDRRRRMVLSTEAEVILYDLARRRVLLRAPWPVVERGGLLAIHRVGDRILFSAARGDREGGAVTGLQVNGWLLLLDVQEEGLRLVRGRKGVRLSGVFQEERAALISSSQGYVWAIDPETLDPLPGQALIDDQEGIGRIAHLGAIQDVVMFQGRLLSIAQERDGPSLKVWDRSTRRPLARLGAADGLSRRSAPRSLSLSPNGRLVLVGTRKGPGILVPLPE